MKTKLLAIIIATCILGIGCQNEFTASDEPTLPPTVVTPDSTQLWKMVVMDSNYVDTASVLFFRYDNQQRISRIVRYDHYVGTDSNYLDLVYNGTDTLAAKMLEYESNLLSTTTYYVYDAQARITKDSVVYNGSVMPGSTYYNNTNKYVYGSTAVTKFGAIYSSAAPNAPFFLDTAYCHPVTVNGNVTSEKDTIHNVTNGYPIMYGNATMTYDDKPALRLKGFPQYVFYKEYTKVLDMMSPGKNNLLTISSLTSAPGQLFTDIRKYVLTYNTHSMVSKADIFFSGGGPLLPDSRVFYFYR